MVDCPHRAVRWMLLLLYVLPGFSWASSVTEKPLMVRNVTLMDTQRIKTDVIVNLMIANNKLVIVSKDELPVDGETRIINAKGGFLLGHLSVGNPVTFMIFTQDPREHRHIILDTKSHAEMAVLNGTLINSKYPIESEITSPGTITNAKNNTQKKRGWLAYTPPPLALATSYQDSRKWNRWESKWIDGIFLGALAVDRQNWVSQDSDNEKQVGPLDEFDRGEIRALRFAVAGTINFESPWVYSIAGATNGFTKGFDSSRDDDISWFDWRVDIPMPSQTTLSIGKQKEPISMERLMGMVFEPMQERAAVSDALLPARNVGIVYSGTGLDSKMSWAVGAFNDWMENSDTFSEGASQVIGRVTLLPYESAENGMRWHLGAGYRYSNGNEGFQYFTEPEFNESPLFVDTGFYESDEHNTYQLESALQIGSVWLNGEYINTDVDSTEAGDPTFDGYHVTASWVLTGETRGYKHNSGVFDNYPVAQSVYQGGWGAWELASRWSSTDLSDGIIDGGEMDVWSLGVNWWLTPTFSVSMNARQIWLDRSGESGDAIGFNTRILLILE
jgi:phosphate-selective porin OprO and OprP